MSIQFQDFLSKFSFEDEMIHSQGFFGRFGFEYALLNEKHIEKSKGALDIPDAHFFIFSYVLVIDHFQDQGTLLKTSFDGAPIKKEEIQSIIGRSNFVEFPFEINGKEQEGKSAKEFEKLTKKALDHLTRGDVFQMVLSNDYQQKYFGDDFAIYRTLRRLNPSPFLFYFDFESYHLFGSSPEAQLKIEKGIAEIHPIAGTEKRVGDDDIDAESIARLRADEKENAEHTMLVDLARNDLSRSCNKVKIDKYKEVQAFSHVFHLVSVVTGELSDIKGGIETFSHTFPAGTLSGTPKPKALELIAKYEKSPREYYGGTVGLLAANGDINMAIVIRSVLSKDGVLHYRAGAGIVLDSDPTKEYEEIQSKLRAVRSAIVEAEKLSNPQSVLS